MIIKREKVIELMNTYCEGNYNKFGRELGVDPSHLHRYIKTGIGGGKKIIGAVIRFCNEKGLNFNDYIEL